jgi:hypothetical protein
MPRRDGGTHKKTKGERNRAKRAGTQRNGWVEFEKTRKIVKSFDNT